MGRVLDREVQRARGGARGARGVWARGGRAGGGGMGGTHLQRQSRSRGGEHNLPVVLGLSLPVQDAHGGGHVLTLAASHLAGSHLAGRARLICQMTALANPKVHLNSFESEGDSSAAADTMARPMMRAASRPMVRAASV